MLSVWLNIVLFGSMDCSTLCVLELLLVTMTRSRGTSCRDAGHGAGREASSPRKCKVINIGYDNIVLTLVRVLIDD